MTGIAKLNDLATTSSTETTSESLHKNRLLAIVSSGESKKYLGKEYSVDEVEKLDKEKIDKMYTSYEAKLSKEMIKSMGSCVFKLYSKALGVSLPIISQALPEGYQLGLDSEDDLTSDLEDDPFISVGLRNVLCEIYYNYGLYLSPVMMTLITSKHLTLKNNFNPIIINGKPPKSNGESDGEAQRATDGNGE